MIRMAWYGWVAEVGRLPNGEAAEGNGCGNGGTGR